MEDLENIGGKQSRYKGSINGDRRADRRYEISLELRWKIVRRKQVVDSGSGRTVDLSSSGILFESGRPLAPGANIELSIVWPALLQNVTPLQLIVNGRIVRSDGCRTAMRRAQHDFKTLGAERRPPGGDAVRPPVSLQIE
jgi:PilZ domain